MTGASSFTTWPAQASKREKERTEDQPRREAHPFGGGYHGCGRSRRRSGGSLAAQLISTAEKCGILWLWWRNVILVLAHQVDVQRRGRRRRQQLLRRLAVRNRVLRAGEQPLERWQAGGQGSLQRGAHHELEILGILQAPQRAVVHHEAVAVECDSVHDGRRRCCQRRHGGRHLAGQGARFAREGGAALRRCR